MEVARDLRVAGLTKSFGLVRVIDEVSLTVAAGTMMALVGPSGCGKTTTLRMIAGLEQPDRGTIAVGGQIITDGARSLPPEARQMGMVFQSYALWPHMTVAQNVAYGLKRKRFAKPVIADKVRAVLAAVDMTPYAARYPAQLSGGQQQRAALARAIATEPRTLLFDEPLSNLDAVLREQMRFEIRSLQQKLGITGVYVTHSQDEALVLADQVAVMRAGRVVQTGTPATIYDAPRTEFVARFIGLANVLILRECGPCPAGMCGRLADGTVITAAAETTGESCRVMVRPESIRLLAAPPPPEQCVNRLVGIVETCVSSGNLTDTMVRLAADPTQTIRVQALPPLRAQPGDRVHLEFDIGRTVILADDPVATGAEA